MNFGPQLEVADLVSSGTEAFERDGVFGEFDKIADFPGKRCQ